jgi:hypothetical protein
VPEDLPTNEASGVEQLTGGFSCNGNPLTTALQNESPIIRNKGINQFFLLSFFMYEKFEMNKLENRIRPANKKHTPPRPKPVNGCQQLFPVFSEE